MRRQASPGHRPGYPDVKKQSPEPKRSETDSRKAAPQGVSADFDPEDVGKTVYLVFRWIGKNNQPGPWSQIVSRLIPG